MWAYCAGGDAFVFDDFGAGFSVVGRRAAHWGASGRAATRGADRCDRRDRATRRGGERRPTRAPRFQVDRELRGSAGEPTLLEPVTCAGSGTLAVETAGGERHDAAEGDELALYAEAASVAPGARAVGRLAV